METHMKQFYIFLLIIKVPCEILTDVLKYDLHYFTITIPQWIWCLALEQAIITFRSSRSVVTFSASVTGPTSSHSSLSLVLPPATPVCHWSYLQPLQSVTGPTSSHSSLSLALPPATPVCHWSYLQPLQSVTGPTSSHSSLSLVLPPATPVCHWPYLQPLQSVTGPTSSHSISPSNLFLQSFQMLQDNSSFSLLITWPVKAGTHAYIFYWFLFSMSNHVVCAIHSTIKFDSLYYPWVLWHFP